MQTFEGAKVFADSRGKSLQTLDVITIQTLAYSDVAENFTLMSHDKSMMTLC